MKRTYIQPAILRVGIASMRLLAGSIGDVPNKVTPGGSGIGTGGNSQESTNEDKDGDGSVDDMSKFNPWSTWEED